MTKCRKRKLGRLKRLNTKSKQATTEEMMKDFNFDLERDKRVTCRNEKYSLEIHESVPSYFCALCPALQPSLDCSTCAHQIWEDIEDWNEQSCFQVWQ